MIATNLSVIIIPYDIDIEICLPVLNRYRLTIMSLSQAGTVSKFYYRCLVFLYNKCFHEPVTL